MCIADLDHLLNIPVTTGSSMSDTAKMGILQANDGSIWIGASDGCIVMMEKDR